MNRCGQRPCNVTPSINLHDCISSEEDKKCDEEDKKCNEEDNEIKECNELAGLDSTGPGQMMKKICNAFTSRVGVEFFDEKGPEKKVAALKESSQRALELEQALRKQKHDALAQMTEFACKITDCSTEENMAEIAADALHQAVGALKQLSAVMMQAAVFWKQMQDHCCTLAESEMKNQVEKALEKYSDEKRLKVWTSRGFKIKAIEFYAGWVALHSVCTTYVEYIKITLQDLYRYIKENPTYEESRVNVKELAQKFLMDLQHDQKELAEKEFATQEKIKALGDPSAHDQ